MTTPNSVADTSDVVRGRIDWSAWVCAGAFFLFGAFPLYNIDAYGHLAQGRNIAELGAVPRLDPFSFWKSTPQPWSNYEWGYDLLTWLVYDAFGPNALILIKCVMLAVLGYVLVALAKRLSNGADLAAPLAATALILFAPFARLRFTVRPQIIGLLFPALLLLGISTLWSGRSSPKRKRWVVLGIVLMQVAWVNMHGSHLLGILITGLFAAFSFRTPAFRQMLLLSVLQLAASACTPFGLGIVTDAMAHVFDPAYRDVVSEWSPWVPGHPLYLLLGPAVAAILVVLVVRPVTKASRYGLAYGAFCVVLSFMAFRSIRFVSHQLLFASPFIAAGLSRLEWAGALRRVAPALLAGAFLLSALLAPRLEPFVPFGFGEPRIGHPFAVAAVVNEHLEEPRIMAPIQESWPLMFAVPRGRFLVDGRVPFYGPAFIRQVANSFSDPPAMSALLDRHSANAVVVDHTRVGQMSAVEYLWRSEDWLLGQVQDRQSLFIRRGASETLTPFVVVAPGYRVGRLLEPGVSEEDIERELVLVGVHPNSTAIRGWIEGLRALRPLARAGGRAGIRMFDTDEERAAARQAYARLSEAAAVFRGFTSIELYRAMAALAACDEPEATEALGWARHAGDSREAALVGIELALRLGDESERASARQQMDQLWTNEQSASDPWLEAIARDARSRCP